MLLEKIQLEPGESVLTQTRRHWFIITMQIVSLTIIGLIPFGLWLVLSLTIANAPTVTVDLVAYQAEFWFVTCVWLLAVWVAIFSAWTNYYLDVLTVTDRRAILINQKGLFWRNVTSFRLERLQDMNVDINGLLATLLDYGTLHVETAGHANEEFRAEHLPKPRELKALILRAADNRIDTTPNHGDAL
jgi:uncharacterized membrane protein YdbT with pleckstrin-like domain